MILNVKHIFIFLALNYLKYLAKIALLINKPFIIGIAGSVGKSSTRNALYAVISQYYKTQMVSNSETGIPLGILGLKPMGFGYLDWLKIFLLAPFGIFNLKDIKYLVVEMGIDDPYPPKNMDYLLTIIKPDIAISLNIFATHTMQFEKLLIKENKNQLNEYEKLDFILNKIADEDIKIITKSNCKIGIFNNDNEYIKRQIEKFEKTNNAALLSFGKDENNFISFLDYKVNLEGTTFTFTIKGQTEQKSFSLNFKDYILPKEYQELFAVTIITSLKLNLSLEQIKTSLEKNFKLPSGRSSIFKGINNTLIIDSSYNSSSSAVLAFLDLLKELKTRTNKKVVFLMGDMRELGNEAKIEHEKIAKELIKTVDFLYCVGPLTKEFVIPIANKAKLKEVKWFQDFKKAGQYLKDNVAHNSLVLVKGSQNTIFLEEAIKYILLNKEDEKQLCRQEDYWVKEKLPLAN